MHGIKDKNLLKPYKKKRKKEPKRLGSFDYRVRNDISR